MYDPVAAISLKTTGLDPINDRIIEVSASVYSGGEISDHFNELVATDIKPSPGITKLTGITPEMLEDARSPTSVFADFSEFLPNDSLCIAHGGPFVYAFLRHATDNSFERPILDTHELAQIVYPSLPGYGMASLRSSLGLESSEHESDTVLALWEIIMEKCMSFPASLLKEINVLLSPLRNHLYRQFFKHITSEVMTVGGDPDQPFRALFREETLPQPRPEPEVDAEPISLDENEVASCFGNEGEFSNGLQGYEHREGQVEMARLVARAFNDTSHLLVEAGTGIGKSLAYLVPAVRWALANSKPVIVSTNTKNLQSQLFEKDLPLIRDLLGLDFRVAIIKGRGNYLCLRKLFHLVDHPDIELENAERVRLLGVLTWAINTRTGDMSELNDWERTGLHGLGAKLVSIGEECLGRQCKCGRRCFLRKARAKSLAADIVVANHALVFAEMNIKSPALPPYEHIIFDEAHNLEDAATRFLSIEISLARFRFILNRLYRPKKKPTGLLLSIMRQLQSGAASGDNELRTRAIKLADRLTATVENIGPDMESFFKSMHGLLDKDGNTRRIDPENKNPAAWTEMTLAQQQLVSSFSRVIHLSEQLVQILRDMDVESLQFNLGFRSELTAVIQWLQEIVHDIDFVLRADEENYVYWVEPARTRQGGARAWAAPLAIGEKLAMELYETKKTIVFSSATLSVRGSFDYMKERLGIDRVHPDRLLTLNAGSPFDYPSQCRIIVPMFLPDPADRDSDYSAELASLLSEVFGRTTGRAMALFTSYKMLRHTADELEQDLLSEGIQVLTQGRSGSRETIISVFKKDLESVLLGTHSFWEGVDLVGETLSCLVIARLPFAVFTEPIIEARCEQLRARGKDPFNHYSLPSAIIRFRQGFGRLIRHRTDRGIVIIADRRVMTKRYGGWFRKSLPSTTEPVTDRDQFLSAISEFLGGE